MKIILKPIAQITPTTEGVEAPSRLQEDFEVSQKQFTEEYADSAQAGKVSFAKDGKSDPQTVTTYTGTNPMKGRVIVR